MASNQKKKKNASGSKKGSGRKSAQKQEQSIFRKFYREIWGVLCLLLAIVVLLSGFAQDSVIARLFAGLFGRAGLILLPIGLILCFVALVFHRKRPVKMRVICAALFVLISCAISHLLKDGPAIGWGGEMLGKLYQGGVDGTAGGVFGGLIGMFFSLLGGRLVALVLCFLLAFIVLMASMNLTPTGVLRAINNQREQKAKERGDEAEEEYREPAEVLVDHVTQRHQEHVERKQERAVRKQERKRFDYDLPVDDPIDGNVPTEAQKKKPAADADFLEVKPDEPKDKLRPQQFLFEDKTPEKTPGTAQKPAGPTTAERALASAKPASSADAGSDEALPPIKPLESDKVKAKDTAIAAAQIKQEIEAAEEAPKPAYVFPPAELLDESRRGAVNAQAEMMENSERLRKKLACFNVDAEIINVTRGPSVTMYELQLAQDVKLSRITGMADDIALELGASGVRISALPERNSVVGIEVPNKSVNTVKIREVIDSNAFRNAPSSISFAVGKDISGNCIVGDIAKMPHVLVAGTTGSGKSVCMNSLIVSLLYKSSPEDVKLIMVDPKMVEFGIYNGIPQLLVPVVTDPKKAAGALQWTVSEMMRRYSLLGDAGTREIESFNKIAATNPAYSHMPQIVVLIDELADLMLVAGKEVEESICRIAQMGRAAGIHLVIATQRPSADVITGLMKANIPSRIAFAVSSAMESRIILDTQGAEKLIGKGDMLFAPLGKGKPRRVQGCFIDDTEVERVVNFVKQHSTPNYSDDVQAQIELKAAQTGTKGGAAAQTVAAAEAPQDDMGDELLPAAVEVILETKQASVSMLQRRLKLGYARAARIVDEMEERGIVGPYEGSKPRQLLITKEQWDAMQSGKTIMELAEEAEENPPVEEELP